MLEANEEIFSFDNTFFDIPQEEAMRGPLGIGSIAARQCRAARSCLGGDQKRIAEVHVPKSARRHGRWIHSSFPRWLQQGMLGLVPRRQRAASHPGRKVFEEEASACF